MRSFDIEKLLVVNVRRGNYKVQYGSGSGHGNIQAKLQVITLTWKGTNVCHAYGVTYKGKAR